MQACKSAMHQTIYLLSLMTGKLLSCLPLFADAQLAHLRSDLKRTRRQAYAAGSVKNMKCQWRAFILFCLYFEFEPLPVSLEVLCLYAQFLGRSFKSPDSIKSYISGVKLLHLFHDMEFPHSSSFILKLTFRGLAKGLAHLPRRAAAMTPDLLLRIFEVLDMSCQIDQVFWALFLVAFFLMARKSNLVPRSAKDFDPRKQLQRRDILVSRDTIMVALKWSKTNQCGSRLLQVPLMAVPGSVLCPVEAYTNMVSAVPAKGRSPAFCIPVGGTVVPVVYGHFQSFLRTVIAKVGGDPAAYSTHSFRRGGASWAFKSKVPADLVQVHGDWRSDAYKVYLNCDVEQRASVSSQMGGALKGLERNIIDE